MRGMRRVALMWLLLAGVAPPGLRAAAARDTTRIRILALDVGAGAIGADTCRATVRNDGGTPFPLALSVRTESPSAGWQRAVYRLLRPGETADVAMEYRVPDRGYRLLTVYFGRAEAMPSDAVPYPAFDAFATRRHVLRPVPRGSDPTAGGDTERRAARAELARILGWDRPAAPDFSPRVLGEEELGDYRISDLRIRTEPAESIAFLLIRRRDMDGPLPTVVYLPGNPPGTRRSGLVPGMILADAGFQVAALDRRETARETDAGEFLSSRADPVFDDRRVVDYLLSRDDVAGDAVGLLGFSAGADEGMFLLALDPAVSYAALASRMVVEDSLFQSAGWAPTLWSPEVLGDVGLAGLVGDWDALWEALTPEVGAAALVAYRKRYPFFDRLDPAEVLPLAAPKPVLVVAGARDPQFPLGGVLALDDAVREAYRGARESYRLDIVPNAGHRLTPEAFDAVVDWFRRWATP